MNRTIRRVIISSILALSFQTASMSQDLIVLKSGQEYPVKIISIKGKTIKFKEWDNQEDSISKISKKYVKMHRMEYLTNERVSISISIGGVPYGTSTNIKSYMKDNGFEGTSRSWLSFKDYPISKVKISWMLEFEYLIKPPHGFSIEFAQTNRGYVQGLNYAGITPPGYATPWYNYSTGLTPEIHYANPQLSASYKYYFKSFKSNLQTGIIMNIAKVWETGENWKSSKYSKVSGGILIGYAGSLFENEVFFLRFQTQFRYVFPLKNTNVDSFLNGEKIGLSHLFIGVQSGIKIARNK